jgi:hypothetical protein
VIEALNYGLFYLLKLLLYSLYTIYKFSICCLSFDGLKPSAIAIALIYSLTLISSCISSNFYFYFSSSFFLCFSSICFCNASFIDYCSASFLFNIISLSFLPFTNISPFFSNSRSSQFSKTLPLTFISGKSIFVMDLSKLLFF